MKDNFTGTWVEILHTEFPRHQLESPEGREQLQRVSIDGFSVGWVGRWRGFYRSWGKEIP